MDIVLIAEALDEEFVNIFIEFIKDGQYQHINKGTGKEQFYRFEKPGNIAFPKMIELFSKKPDYLAAIDVHLAPIHVSDDVVSLSAILLSEEYYELLQMGSIDVDGLSVLDLEYILLFKIKAWLDLSERKANGEKIDLKNIKKHKSDVIRVTTLLEPDKTIKIDGKVKQDVELFLKMIEEEQIDLKSLKIRNVTYRELLDQIRKCYL